MSKKIFVTPEYTTAEEIKNVRKKLGLTQKEFAELLGSSKSTVERWETSSSHIRGALVLLLQLLEKEQNYVEKMKVPPKVYPIRLWYMHKQTICTLIDVDEINQKIQIKITQTILCSERLAEQKIRTIINTWNFWNPDVFLEPEIK